MTKLSVNINKIATLRNARGGKYPDVVKVAIDCERFGADGITVHPRPDERHITRKDVENLAKVVTTEFNIEGYPDERFMQMIEEIRPTQATLVPDSPEVLTSNSGWDCVQHKELLKEIVTQLKSWNVRSAIFIDTNLENIAAAVEIGVERIEFYTGPFAEEFSISPEKAIEKYVVACELAIKKGLEINAGHDLSLENLRFFKEKMPQLDEVSIGHALISDALYLGLENTVRRYKYLLRDE